MSDCPGALAKLVLTKRNTKTSLMKLKFFASKAVHYCYQCWKFELKISSDSGDMHFSAIKPRWGGCPPLSIFFSWSISLFVICSHFLRLVSFLAEIVKLRRGLSCLQQNSLKELQISKCLDGQLISGMTGFVAIRSMQRQECVQNSQSKFKRKEAFCYLRQFLIPGSILHSWIYL